MFYYQKKGIPSENPFLFRKELYVHFLTKILQNRRKRISAKLDVGTRNGHTLCHIWKLINKEGGRGRSNVNLHLVTLLAHFGNTLRCQVRKRV